MDMWATPGDCTPQPWRASEQANKWTHKTPLTLEYLPAAVIWPENLPEIVGAIHRVTAEGRTEMGSPCIAGMLYPLPVGCKEPGIGALGTSSACPEFTLQPPCQPGFLRGWLSSQALPSPGHKEAPQEV